MQESIISKFTTAKLLEKYYRYHYCDLVNVKVKPKVEQNDLYMIVRLQSTLNHKKVVEKEILNEGQIKKLLTDYLEINYCTVESIDYEPYFHNLNIKYDGDFNLETKKSFVKMKRVV